MEEVEVTPVDVAVAVVIRTAVDGRHTVSDVIPCVVARKVPGSPLPRNPRVVSRKRSFSNAIIDKIGVDL
jgi:hypothetical protein